MQKNRANTKVCNTFTHVKGKPHMIRDKAGRAPVPKVEVLETKRGRPLLITDPPLTSSTTLSNFCKDTFLFFCFINKILEKYILTMNRLQVTGDT